MLDADWEDRFQQAVVLDNDGFLYVMSGGVGVDVMSVMQDVWRSTVSFHDLPTIARLCGVTIPTCGTGIKCWPGPGTVIATDGSFVSCKACPQGDVADASSSSASTPIVIALVVFVLLFVAAAGLAGYLYNKQRTAQGGPIAFPSDHFGTSVDTTGLMGSSSL